MVNGLARRVRSHFLAALALTSVLLVAGAVVPAVLSGPPKEVFCTAGLAFTTIDGVGVALEDQGGAGAGKCDMNVERWLSVNSNPDEKVLGFDCKIRIDGMVVVATTTPNRPDGLCGQAVPLRNGDQP